MVATYPEQWIPLILATLWIALSAKALLGLIRKYLHPERGDSLVPEVHDATSYSSTNLSSLPRHEYLITISFGAWTSSLNTAGQKILVTFYNRTRSVIVRLVIPFENILKVHPTIGSEVPPGQRKRFKTEVRIAQFRYVTEVRLTDPSMRLKNLEMVDPFQLTNSTPTFVHISHTRKGEYLTVYELDIIKNPSSISYITQYIGNVDSIDSAVTSKPYAHKDHDQGYHYDIRERILPENGKLHRGNVLLDFRQSNQLIASFRRRTRFKRWRECSLAWSELNILYLFDLSFAASISLHFPFSIIDRDVLFSLSRALANGSVASLITALSVQVTGLGAYLFFNIKMVPHIKAKWSRNGVVIVRGVLILTISIIGIVLSAHQYQQLKEIGEFYESTNKSNNEHKYWLLSMSICLALLVPKYYILYYVGHGYNFLFVPFIRTYTPKYFLPYDVDLLKGATGPLPDTAISC